jgi:hypothetical protein
MCTPRIYYRYILRALSRWLADDLTAKFVLNDGKTPVRSMWCGEEPGE